MTIFVVIIQHQGNNDDVSAFTNEQQAERYFEEATGTSWAEYQRRTEAEEDSDTILGEVYAGSNIYKVKLDTTTPGSYADFLNQISGRAGAELKQKATAETAEAIATMTHREIVICSMLHVIPQDYLRAKAKEHLAEGGA